MEPIWAGQGSDFLVGNNGEMVSQMNNSLFYNDVSGNTIWNFTLPRDEGMISSIAISKDGHFIGVGSENQSFFFLTSQGKILWETRLSDVILTIVISREGERIALLSNDRVYFFNRSGMKQGDFDPFVPLTSIAISYDQDSVIIGGDSTHIPDSSKKDLFFIDEYGTILWKYKTNGINKVAICDDGQYAAIASGSDHRIYLFSKDGEELWNYSVWNAVWDAAISSDCSNIVIGTGTYQNFANVEKPGLSEVIYFNKEGSRIWNYSIGSFDETVCSATDGCNRRSDVRWNDVIDVDISSDGKYITAGALNNTVYLFDDKGRVIDSFHSDDEFQKIQFSPDGKYIAARFHPSVNKLGVNKFFLFSNPEKKTDNGISHTALENSGNTSLTHSSGTTTTHDNPTIPLHISTLFAALIIWVLVILFFGRKRISG